MPPATRCATRAGSLLTSTKVLRVELRAEDESTHLNIRALPQGRGDQNAWLSPINVLFAVAFRETKPLDQNTCFSQGL